jgi:hypothetical protein
MFVGHYGPIVFGAVIFALQVSGIFTPPPASPVALASTALGAYFAFAVVAWRLDRHRVQA